MGKEGTKIHITKQQSNPNLEDYMGKAGPVKQLTFNICRAWFFYVNFKKSLFISAK